MNDHRFDRISRLFAGRTRTKAINAQDATPVAVPAEPWDGEKTMYLFVQSFQSGAITPVEGQEGRYTVTLEQGTGQTIYFADRPSRDVGVTETPQFLEGLGFPEDNPPNAALIVETDAGDTDIAVVELFNPTYDPTTRGVTYDVEVLENWQEDLELGLREEPADLATLAAEFGTAHLLIDDCPQLTIACRRWADSMSEEDVGYFWDQDSCWNYSLCFPCEPYGHDQPDRCATPYHWQQKCNDQFPGCDGKCWPEFSWPFVGTGCF